MDISNQDIDFGVYKIDLASVFSHLKSDMRDDWFLDPIKYNDRFSKDKAIEYITNNIEANNGHYKPSSRILVNIPKPQRTLRYSLETHFYDRLAYHCFGTLLVKSFDNLLSKRVLSHRYNTVQENSSYLYLNAIEQWKKFEEYTKLASEGNYILCTDLQNYFENITIKKLHSVLLTSLKELEVSGPEKAKIRFCIDSVIDCLASWSYNGENGLPQNRDISSFLASIYIREVDDWAVKNGINYYRYMDDIRIVCESREKAYLYLKQLTILLREYGITINGYKTSILEPGTKEHTEYITNTGFSLERIDSLINSKKKSLVIIAYKEIVDKMTELIIRKDYLSREFRFYISRISKLMLCTDIKKPQNLIKPLTKGFIEAIQDIPAATDQIYQYLLSADISIDEQGELASFLMDENKAIYGWQNYLIWKILAFYNYKTDKIVSYANAKLSDISNAPSVAGAMIYVGKCCAEHRKTICQNFSQYSDFFLQRHALISIQEMDYREVSSISPYVSAESKGVYRDLHSMREHIYVSPPDKVKYTDLINEVAFYA